MASVLLNGTFIGTLAQKRNKKMLQKANLVRMDLLLDPTLTRYQCNLCFSYLQLHKNTKFRHRRCLYLFDSSSYRHPQLDGYYVCLICFVKYQFSADLSLHYSSQHHPLTCKQLGFNVDILCRVSDEKSNNMRCLLPFA